MRKRSILIWVLLMFAPALWGLQLPETIASYYRDWNFVALNSTPQQRETVWKRGRHAHETELSQKAKDLLWRMKRILQLTEVSPSSMPMLLSDNRPPVTSEVLAPLRTTQESRTQIIILVSVMQVPRGRTGLPFRILRDANRSTRMLAMCQYTDIWVLRGSDWRVIRSPAVWVATP